VEGGGRDEIKLLCVGSETKIKFIKVSLSHGNAVVAMK
jgi:hypothetical protein